jgi:hypothetical protein
VGPWSFVRREVRAFQAPIAHARHAAGGRFKVICGNRYGGYNRLLTAGYWPARSR